MSALPSSLYETTLRPALAGASATLCGNGLARFAYVPLFPAMVSAGWVTGPEAGLLGALNLAGYLIGVLGGRVLARRIGTARALDAGMGLVVVALVACSWHAGVPWLAAWRLAAGVAGGVLMALAGPAVQSAVPMAKRGFAGGLVLAGVGAGIVVSSVAVPSLLPAGISQTWLGLAAIAAALWVFAFRAWPTDPIVLPQGRAPGAVPLYIAYALSAAAFVPHMVYFADLVVRGRSYAVADAAFAWFLFGLGGLFGPVLGGRMADRWGGAATVQAWILLQAISLAMVFLPGRTALFGAALVGGSAAVGISSAALARARELAGAAAGSVWVRATAAFAVAQALTGFGLAALFARTGSHEHIFAVGFALAAAALVPTFLRSATTLRPGGPDA